MASLADPWFGPLSAWSWVLGVNLWGVIHGVRAFLPILLAQGEGHIVNTASSAGLNPGSGPIYAAGKHAVVALSEELFKMTRLAALPVGVSVPCPSWVRTGIADAERNWPATQGDRPPRAAAYETLLPHLQRAIQDGMSPAGIAELVAEAIESERFWILPHPDSVERAAQRWQRIAGGHNPDPTINVPGLPPTEQIAAEIKAAMAQSRVLSRMPARPGTSRDSAPR